MEQLKEDDALKYVLKKLGSKYEYIRFIGQGSFSKVYLLHHKILGQDHALKIMDSHYILQTLEKANVKDISKEFELIKKRFVNEARAYSKIDHPGVVRIYDVDVLEDEKEGLDITYIIMQFVEGRSLKNILHETAPLPMDRVLAISRDILDAVGSIHKTGIVHRDLKPANIIIEKESSRAIIIDFGLAKNLVDETNLTGGGSAMGTPVYMAPEQCENRKRIDPATDIYSIGILLYEMLTGEVPYKGNFTEVIQGHLMVPVPDIREKNPLTPKEMHAVLQKTLAKDPMKRYRNAEDMLQDIWKIENDLAVEKARKEKEKKDKLDSKETGEQEIKKRKYFKYLSIALVALTAATIIYLFITPTQKSESSRYKENVDKVRSYLAIGEYGKAEYHLIAAAKINNTAEVKELDAKIQAGKLAETVKKDFEALGALLKSDAAVDKKIAECRKFLDKYANIAPDDVTKSLLTQVQQNITQLVDKYNSDVEEYINKGELKKAVESLKLAKKQGETAITRELANKLFTACISKSESYCNEAKPQEAEEYYLLAKEIKPGTNLQDLNKTIQFLKSMPEGVRTIYYKVNKQIKQNQQNAWEADFGNGIVMVYIPPSGNLPGFWMGKTEVSVKQYLQFANENPSHKPEWQEKGSRFNVETGDDNYYRNQTADPLPIVGISWENAKAYCQWLSKKMGVTVKLPSEAQWQKAAQGTDSRKYPWGNNFPANNLANFSLAAKTVKVDTNPMGASPYGLLNMAGNVEEWCDNQYARGGNFYDNERFITCSSRRKYEPSERNNALGFRVVIGEW